MPTELTDAIRTIQHLLGGVSPALAAMVLLGGPTAVWILYRFFLQPRTSRYVYGGSEPLWVCANCRSANAFTRAACYRCGFEPAAHHDLEVVVGDPADPEVQLSPGVAVGPGYRVPATALGAPAYDFRYLDDRYAKPADEPYDEVGPAEGEAPATEVPAGAPEPKRAAATGPGVPVGPGRPAATAPRRSVVAGPRSDPAGE